MTRAELAAHIKGIDQRFSDVAEDISEIKQGIQAMLAERKKRWRAWGPPLVAAFVAGVIALPAYIIH